VERHNNNKLLISKINQI